MKSSLVDYPGMIAAVVFTPGCNLRCSYCHNPVLRDADSEASGRTQEEVLSWLGGRRGLLDAVVVSGGEPTIQRGIAEFMAEVRALGYLVKLDTNGTQPDVLASLIDAGVLDYVGMDIKAPAEKYDEICGVSVDQGAIDESIALLMEGSVDHEFRTTVIPQLTPEDLLTMGNRIRCARTYVLQRYRRPQAGRSSDSPGSVPADRTPPWIEAVRQRLGSLVENCVVRGFGFTCIRST
ncbi:MAG: anaerobic ribonucleoside-triphosphate reductase activating protein [Candidatus Hydrogenedentes bacterium]|nr:anaerobic ribonucleoside-triphosphate reductase activating protein [Candidatus Hydrogenedentota bacterium]